MMQKGAVYGATVLMKLFHIHQPSYLSLQSYVTEIYIPTFYVGQVGNHIRSLVPILDTRYWRDSDGNIHHG
jgi:hypothetical protein